MSDSVLTDIARFAVHGVLHVVTNSEKTEPPLPIASLCNPEAVLDGEFSWQSDPEQIPEQVVSHGWIYRGYEAVGDDGVIYADKWVKGRLTVYLLNESPHAFNGAKHKPGLTSSYFMSVLSSGRRGRRAIEAFCEDHGINCDIKVDSLIRQSVNNL